MHISAFDLFIKLVENDHEIDQFLNQKKILLAELNRAQLDFEQIQVEIAQQHQVTLATRKKIDALELELKTLDIQEQEKKRRIDSASTTREYYSLQQEIKDLQHQREQYEEPLFQLWQQAEEAENTYNKLMQQAPDKTQVIQGELDHIAKRIEMLDNTITKHQQLREKYLQEADQELTLKYLSLKERIANPVVRVKNDSCSACFFTLNQQDLLSIRRNQLINCRDCYRLLYSPISETKA